MEEKFSGDSEHLRWIWVSELGGQEVSPGWSWEAVVRKIGAVPLIKGLPSSWGYQINIGKMNTRQYKCDEVQCGKHRL